jgi:hypothetical protein
MIKLADALPEDELRAMCAVKVGAALGQTSAVAFGAG